MDQATVVSDLKKLVELRQDIANNPTPEVSEDEGGDATPCGYSSGSSTGSSPGCSSRKHSLGPPRVMIWMTISLMRSILLLQSVKESSGPFRFLRTNRSSNNGLLDWIVSLFVRRFIHFQALNEQHEREEHARQAEAMERASASGTVADDENPSG